MILAHKDDMAQGIGLALKKLREAAVPSLSVRELAKQLKMLPSTYAHYEDRFKGEYLPVGLIEKLTPILTARGVARDLVVALGGAQILGPDAQSIDEDLLSACISAVDIADKDSNLQLTPLDRSRIIAKIYSEESLSPSGDIEKLALRLLIRLASDSRNQPR